MLALLGLLALAASPPAVPAADDAASPSPASTGSALQFHPLSHLLNEAGDIGQLDGHDRQLGRLWAPDGWRRLGGTLSHPLAGIRRQGWDEFLGTELVPTSLDPSRAQWIPNWQVHLLGGGYNHILLEDWYRDHGSAHPTLLACATTYAGALLNEAAERQGQAGQRSTDPLADLLVFDAASLALFRLPGVRPFLTGTLEMRNWPLQPTLTPDGRLENAGQYWMLRSPLPLTRWKLLYHFGLGNIAGVSAPLPHGRWLSLAAGAHASRSVNLEDQRQTCALSPKVGLFLDQGGSLLASAFWNGQSKDRLTLQVHPTPWTTWPVPWGFWVHGGGSSGWGAGVTTTLGIGLGV